MPRTRPSRTGYCCGTGQCGSCAVRVNGEPVLACMTEAKDGMIIEPLNLPVKKDLLVDMEPVLAKIASIVPKEGACIPSREEVEALKPLRSCIECLACVSVCPAMEVAEFAGPLSMRQEMRLAIDPRDSCDRITDAIRDGLFMCTTCQYCWKVCPKNIEIPGKAIEKLRRMVNRRGLTLPRHTEVAALVAETAGRYRRTRRRSSNRSRRSSSPPARFVGRWASSWDACTTTASPRQPSMPWRSSSGTGYG